MIGWFQNVLDAIVAPLVRELGRVPPQALRNYHFF